MRADAGVAVARPAASWLPRAAAVVSFLAAVFGVLVAPGLRGLAKDVIVDRCTWLAWTLAYLMCGLLMAAIVAGALDLGRSEGVRGRDQGVSKLRVQGASKALVVLASGTVMALAAPALIRPLPTLVSAAVAVAAAAAGLAGVWHGLRARQPAAALRAGFFFA